MASLPSLLARGHLRSRRLPPVHAVSLRFQHTPPSASQPRPVDLSPDGRVDLFPSTRVFPVSGPRGADATVASGVKGRATAGRLESEAFNDLINTLKPLGIPYPVIKALLQEFPHFRHPTSAQVTLLKSVLIDGNDVFLKEKTGRGKTLAMSLIALSRAFKIRFRRRKTASRHGRNASSSSPSILLLLPHAALVGQVAEWLARLQGAMQAGLGDDALMSRAVMPGDKPPQDSGLGPEILISTPDALLAYLSVSPSIRPSQSRHKPATSSLARSLQLLMVDEVDAMLRPLPGRFKTFGSERERSRHPFYRHPPSIVPLLNDMIRLDDAEGRVQTVWSSATLNSVVRGFIQRSGWIRRHEQTMVDTTQNSPSVELSPVPPAGNVVHYCLTVDPLSGQMRNLGESTEPGISDTIALDPTDDHAPSERIHPLMLESLALLYASRPPADSSGHALAILPSGASMATVQRDLSAHGISSEILDGTSPSSPSTSLLLIDRAHVRGLDLPRLTTVYLLNGLDASGLSKSSRAAGGMEDRKREYTHFAGRLDRLGGRGTGGYEMVSLVMRGSGEEKALQGMWVDRTDLRVGRKDGAGIEC